MGYQIFYKRVHMMWKPREELDILDLGHDCFLINCDLEEDLDIVYAEGS